METENTEEIDTMKAKVHMYECRDRVSRGEQLSQADLEALSDHVEEGTTSDMMSALNDRMELLTCENQELRDKIKAM